MYKLKQKSKTGFEMNPIVVAVLFAVTIIIMWLGGISIFSAYFSHLESKAKSLANEVVDNINHIAQSWEGNLTDVRIKRNVYILKHDSNEIEVYSYKEIFEQRPWEVGRGVATPVIKFDRYYTYTLPMDMKITFLEGTPLRDSGKTEIALQVDAPNASVSLFEIDGDFLRFTDADKTLPGSLDERGRKGKEFDGRHYIEKYWRGDWQNEVYYGRQKACTPPSCVSYNEAEIGISYKKDIIGKIFISADKNTLQFLPKGLDAREFNRKGDASCQNFFNGNCYADNQYYPGKPDEPTRECTFYQWDCYKNGAIMAKPDGSSCQWQPWVCSPI